MTFVEIVGWMTIGSAVCSLAVAAPIVVLMFWTAWRDSKAP